MWCTNKSFDNWLITAIIAVLAYDVRIDAAGRHAQLGSQEVSESCRVQRGAAAEDSIPGQTAQFPRHVRQYVHRIGHHEDYGVRREFHQIRNDVFQDSHVPLDQLQTRFSRLLTNTGRYHAHPWIGSNGIVCTKTDHVS